MKLEVYGAKGEIVARVRLFQESETKITLWLVDGYGEQVSGGRIAALTSDGLVRAKSLGDGPFRLDAAGRIALNE